MRLCAHRHLRNAGDSRPWEMGRILAKRYELTFRSILIRFHRDGNIVLPPRVTAGMDLPWRSSEEDHGSRLASDVARRSCLVCAPSRNQVAISAPRGPMQKLDLPKASTELESW